MVNPTPVKPTLTFNPVTAGFFLFLHVGAMFAFLPSLFSWSAVAVMLVLYWMTASLGICLGFHRYLTHKGLEIPGWLAYFLVFCGTLACENGPLKWVAHHRMHHGGSDTEKDPHNAAKSFWWAHLLWMLYRHSEFDDPKKIAGYTGDISGDKFYQFLDKHFIAVQVALGLLLLAIGGLSFVVWGIFVRIVLVYHATWLVNSAAHCFGYKNFELENDLSTNCWWVGLLACGEGWHNNHHAFPQSARHGLRPWEIDLTWLAICALRALGLAKNIKVVELERVLDAEASRISFRGQMVRKAA